MDPREPADTDRVHPSIGEDDVALALGGNNMDQRATLLQVSE
jgi:hypothetical protein